VLNQNIVKENC